MPGWSLGFGKLNVCQVGPFEGGKYYYVGMLVDADGTRHPQKLSEKPHERANLLAIRRLIAT
jgi:hypothetical protein